MKLRIPTSVLSLLGAAALVAVNAEPAEGTSLLTWIIYETVCLSVLAGCGIAISRRIEADHPARP